MSTEFPSQTIFLVQSLHVSGKSLYPTFRYIIYELKLGDQIIKCFSYHKGEYQGHLLLTQFNYLKFNVVHIKNFNYNV